MSPPDTPSAPADGGPFAADSASFAAALVGPTAAGKTGLSLALAEKIELEIINLDAMQIFRGLDVGTCKPSAEERASAPHHLFDIREPDQPLGAGAYASLAAGVVAEIQARGRLPLFVGGTGFYLRTLREGLAPVPTIPEEVRRDLAREVAARGVKDMHVELSQVDPRWADRVHPHDRQRIIRGLEVFRATGKPLSEHLEEPREGALPCPLVALVLDPGQDVLRVRIRKRVSQMLDDGLIGEVEGLLDAGLAPTAHGFQAPGYREVLALLAGKLDEKELAPQIARAHRHYARRQRTFLKREQGLVPVRSAEDALHAVEEASTTTDTVDR